MDDLKKLLDISNLNETEIPDRFKKIAEDLMCNHIIKKGKKEYAIIEIEFYLYSPSHRDYITYPREIEAGRWFFHQSGVDLTFKSTGIKLIEDNNKESFEISDNAIFGGILIRGLYDLGNSKYIFGPYKCVNLLWDDFNALFNDKLEYPIIKKSEEVLIGKIVKLKRHIKIDVDKQESKVFEWAERANFLSGSESNKKLILKYKEELFTENNDKYLYRFFNIIDGETTWKAIKHLTLAEKEKLK